MAENSLTLWVTGADPDDLDGIYDASRTLRSDLEEISDVSVTDLMTEHGQEGTRSGLLTQIVAEGGAALIVTYYGGKTVRGIFRDLAEIVQRWQDRNKGNRVVLRAADGSTIELTGLSGEEAVTLMESIKDRPEVLEN
ncbi:hypothetical protein [Actinophytocola oryzae]|uniref:Uncharacterized protein n=1 Tax=Actinophytocola oryzae TaxID=502181 RepID=A0A4R7VRY2_9PSEU|nr:hypothetical protein [Actinophytocola oryzae]TDV52442.1 hypothetical protein CLV71_105574 [Actinophytocola oryzae]